MLAVTQQQLGEVGIKQPALAQRQLRLSLSQLLVASWLSSTWLHLHFNVIE